jgi:hypothetical protein
MTNSLAPWNTAFRRRLTLAPCASVLLALAGCGGGSSQVVAPPPPPPPINVSVAPMDQSVQAGQTHSFTASVNNDSSNRGVTWSLSQGGQSCAPACGSLSNQALLSVTYNAPSPPLNTPTVSLAATSVADNTKTGIATITVTPPNGGGGSVPTFADNHVSASNTQGNPVNRYDFRLPNPTLAANCVVVGFQYSASAGATASVSDDKGNIYSILVNHNDTRQVVAIAVALNVTAGAQKISITFSGGTPAFVSAVATEFYNVAHLNALDGTTGNDGTQLSVTAGTLASTTNGDLIYQYAVQDTPGAMPMTAWTQGSNPWSLLSADLLDGSAAQYQVQPAAATITPTLGMAPSQNFNSVAIALKAATAGTPPPAGIRVARLQHNSIPANANTPLPLQFPCTGNLIVVAWVGVPGHNLIGVTDHNNNPYLSAGPAFELGLSGNNQIYYAASASTATTLVGPTLTTSGNSDPSGSTALLFDIRGAAASPLDMGAGLATASATQGTPGSVTAATISPTTSNGLVISSIGVDSNTINGVSPGNFLSSLPAPVSSPNPVDQNNGWALFYNATPGPLTFVWTSQGGPVNDWASIAAAFKAAP